MGEINTGLEGVVVGATEISNVDGDIGRLSYRGFTVNSLVHRPFCQVAWLLLFGDFPNAGQEQQLAHFLLAHRELSPCDQQQLAAIPADTHPMLMLQALVPTLDLTLRESLELPTQDEQAARGLVIAARLPSLVAAFYRRQQGLDWPLRSHALSGHEAFLKSMHGTKPSAEQVAILDQVQILQMEHSFNAGTFAGRVALSTRAPIQSSIAASIGTLFGELHGGADQAALETARAVGVPEAAAAHVRACLSRGERIMGMGHREYQTVDPRATLLKPLARRLCTDPDSARLLATLEAIEAACIAQQKEKSNSKVLRANVEFYKGAVFHALGIPSHYFTALFTMARVFGYLAHALEFAPQARLIRPRALYIGRQPREPDSDTA